MTIAPEIGALIGKHPGITPEILTTIQKGKFYSFSQSQLNFGLGENGVTFQYHWTEMLGRVHKHLSLGGIVQVYHEKGFLEVDLGPYMKIHPTGNTYVKVWPAKSMGPDNESDAFLFVGFGVMF